MQPSAIVLLCMSITACAPMLAFRRFEGTPISVAFNNARMLYLFVFRKPVAVDDQEFRPHHELVQRFVHGEE